MPAKGGFVNSKIPHRQKSILEEVLK